MIEGFDVVVVGAGATGAWAAKELTEAGARVLLLDAGDRRGPAPWDPSQEQGDWLAAFAERQPIQSRCPAFTPSTAQLFVDDVDHPYVADKPFDWFRIRAVGGRTLVGARALLRFSDHEFKAATRDGFGCDWPLSYRDLEPHYDKVERGLGIEGSREGLAHLPDGRYRAELDLDATGRRFRQVVEGRWPDRRVLPARLLVGEYRTVLEAAERTGRLTVRTATVARAVLVDLNTGRASGVAFVDRDTGADGEARARVVVLCASTIESTRILLNSATRQHPGGLGNSSGLLGRHLMDHLVASPALALGALAVEHAPRQRAWPVILPSFRNLQPGQAPFLRGYLFQLIGIEDGPQREQMFAVQTFGEVLPRFENRVSLDPERTDAHGMPIARIEMAYGDNEERMAEDQRATIAEILRAAGIESFQVNPTMAPPGYSAHEVGTARMGSDPKTSVVDPYCGVWDAPNVFVTDGSCFVTSGYQNPTLTMMAITVRACARIADVLRGVA